MARPRASLARRRLGHRQCMCKESDRTDGSPGLRVLIEANRQRGALVVVLPSLGDLRTIGFELGRGLHVGAHDGDVPVVALFHRPVDCEHPFTPIGALLGFERGCHRYPAVRTTGFTQQPVELGIGELVVEVLRRSQQWDLHPLRKRCDEGAAVRGVLRVPLDLAVGFTGSPIHMHPGKPVMGDVSSIQHLEQPLSSR